MKILVAIVSCHSYRDREAAIRRTWLPELAKTCDYKFFVGRPPWACGQSLGGGTFCVNDKDKCHGGPSHMWTGSFGDRVMLDVDDSYAGLCAKTKAICAWAKANGYDILFKCDDDVYLQPERLMLSKSWELGDYVGRKRGPSGNFPAPYASGFSYWLKGKALDVMAEAELTADTAEDRWTANTLHKVGISCRPDYRYVVVSSKTSARSGPEGPRFGNDVISACECPPAYMDRLHEQWLGSPSQIPGKIMHTDPLLGKVSVLIKTFMRDGFLNCSVSGILHYLPEVKVIIVDDGYEASAKITWYAGLRYKGHTCLWLPFDSGFGAKSNEGVSVNDREFLLIGSDDFIFNERVREHVQNMVRLLEVRPDIDIVSGRLNNNPYESCLKFEGARVVETPGYKEEGRAAGLEFKVCDLTVNFSLIRQSLLKKIRWDEDVKIGGGEHGAFFVDVMRAGGKVAYLVGASIDEIKTPSPAWQHKDYPTMRARARKPGLPCLIRRGIKEWVCQDGRVETA